MSKILIKYLVSIYDLYKNKYFENYIYYPLHFKTILNEMVDISNNDNKSLNIYTMALYENCINSGNNSEEYNDLSTMFFNGFEYNNINIKEKLKNKNLLVIQLIECSFDDIVYYGDITSYLANNIYRYDEQNTYMVVTYIITITFKRDNNKLLYTTDLSNTNIFTVNNNKIIKVNESIV